MDRSTGAIKSFSLWTVILTVICACNESFVPLENRQDSPFSMYGFLDASADTQWIRAIPIRDQLETPPELPEMKVTIEDLETGEKVAMNDSLFQFRQQFNVINSWSVFEIEPEKSYRVEGVLPSGYTSSVSITTPKDFPVPNIDDFKGGCSGLMLISGVEILADVKSVWHIRFYFSETDFVRIIAIPYRQRAVDIGKGNFYVSIDSNRELSVITEDFINSPDSIEVLKREIFVASAGPEWNDEITDLEQLEYFLPVINSNIENGVGYMVGIVSKTIQMNHCY